MSSLSRRLMRIVRMHRHPRSPCLPLPSTPVFGSPAARRRPIATSKGLSGVPEGELEAVSAEDAMAHTGRVLGFEYGAANCEAQGRELLGLSGVPEGELEAACSLEPSVRREERVAVPRVIASSAAFLRIASTASSRSSRLPVHVARSLATRVEWYLHGCPLPYQ